MYLQRREAEEMKRQIEQKQQMAQGKHNHQIIFLLFYFKLTVVSTQTTRISFDFVVETHRHAAVDADDYGRSTIFRCDLSLYASIAVVHPLSTVHARVAVLFLLDHEAKNLWARDAVVATTTTSISTLYYCCHDLALLFDLN